MNLYFSYANAISMDLWKVAPTFINPNGILAYINVPEGVVNAIYSWSSGWTEI